MKYIFSFVFLFVTLQAALAQDKPVITLEKGKLKSNSKVISAKQATELMAKYPEALSYMKGAKSNLGAVQVFGFIGGGLIGFPVGTLISGGDPNWALAGIGGAFLLVALPFNANFKEKAQMAIKLYNDASPQAFYRKPTIKMGLLETGFGLRFSF